MLKRFTTTQKLKLYKALNREPDETLSCHPARNKYQKYVIGKTYKVEGDVKICKNGFHACRQLKQVFNYYDALWSTAIAYGKWSVDILRCRESSIGYALMKSNKKLMEYIKNIPQYDEEIFETITNLKKTRQ